MVQIDSVQIGLNNFDAGFVLPLDVGVARHDLSDIRPGAVDQVEHALRRAGGMHDLGDDNAADRGDLGRLQHNCAAGGESGRHLADDLVERPAPEGDQGRDADRLRRSSSSRASRKNS